MYLLLMYDIAHDGARTKVAVACEDYGLDRVQYSAFSGMLSKGHQRALMRRIAKILGNDKEGRIVLIPISTDDWDKRIEVRVGYDD